MDRPKKSLYVHKTNSFTLITFTTYMPIEVLDRFLLLIIQLCFWTLTICFRGILRMTIILLAETLFIKNDTRI